MSASVAVICFSNTVTKILHEGEGDRPPKAGGGEAHGFLAVRTVDLAAKDEILAAMPGTFFTTPHFDGYPAVLVQLEKIGLEDLHEVIVEAWLARAPKRLAQSYIDRLHAER